MNECRAICVSLLNICHLRYGFVDLRVISALMRIISIVNVVIISTLLAMAMLYLFFLRSRIYSLICKTLGFGLNMVCYKTLPVYLAYTQCVHDFSHLQRERETKSDAASTDK